MRPRDNEHLLRERDPLAIANGITVVLLVAVLLWSIVAIATGG